MSDIRIGDIVETVKGAEFWGRVIALDNDERSPGCTVLANVPGFRGTKHVYPLAQLRRRAPALSPEEVVAKARILLDRVMFDERGTVVAGKAVGGNGGLLSRETIIAAEHLHRALGAFDAANEAGQ